MTNAILKLAMAAICGTVLPLCHAQDVAPDALLKAVTLEVIEIIRKDKDIQAGNPAKVAELVERKILPHFDFERMTQIAAARSWRLASSGQQAALTGEFKTLLVRTYSTALAGYRNQVIEFKPLRAAPADAEVTVKSVIRQSGTAPIAMDYDMERLAGGWKVYDIKIDGMSLVSTYRETFAGIVRDSGMDGLIKTLADKNRPGTARIRSDRTGDFILPVLFHSVRQ